MIGLMVSNLHTMDSLLVHQLFISFQFVPLKKRPRLWAWHIVKFKLFSIKNK